MARSELIYVVLDPANGYIAPFTVKHELVSWLSRRPADEQKRVLICRCQDGVHKERSPVPVTLAELGLPS